MMGKKRGNVMGNIGTRGWKGIKSIEPGRITGTRWMLEGTKLESEMELTE